MDNLIDTNVVLISDERKLHEPVLIESRNLEYPLETRLARQKEAIKNICKKMYFYESPQQFLDNIHSHKNDLVISFWSGSNSRNRRAFIPAICESYGIKYVGGDAHAMILGQNKWLSKSYLQRWGINTTRGVLLKQLSDIVLTENLKYPLVIKPNYEGGSIGISNQNLINNYDELRHMTLKLFEIFKDHLIVEEFIEGIEISIIIFGNQNKIKLIEAIKFESLTDSFILEKGLFSLEVKKRQEAKIIKKLVTKEISQDLFQKSKDLFLSLGKIEILRLDGRIQNGQFLAIELTPDIGLYHSSSFYKAFEVNKYSFEDMFRLIVNNALEKIEVRNAKRQETQDDIPS